MPQIFLRKCFSGGKKGIYSKSIVGDLTKGLPILDNTYNGIVSSGTFTHGHVGPEALFEITRILSKGVWQFCL